MNTTDGTDQVGTPGQGFIKDGNMASFAQDVLETSRSVPVIVDFWAPWCEPCKQLGPMLEKLVNQAGGLVQMVKINVDENQELAAQMRVQSVPSVYAFKHGQPVDAFSGAQPESQIKAFIQRLTGGAQTPVDEALAQAKENLDQGDPETASAIYAQILGHDPENGPALGGLIRCLMASGEPDQARQLIDGLEPRMLNDKDIAAAISALELSEQSGDGADIQELRNKVANDDKDHQARFDLALALYGAGNAEGALEALLEIISRDRAWNEEAARKQMVKIFEALGPTDPLTVSARRQLSSILFS